MISPEGILSIASPSRCSSSMLARSKGLDRVRPHTLNCNSATSLVVLSSGVEMCHEEAVAEASFVDSDRCQVEAELLTWTVKAGLVGTLEKASPSA